jgi:hypothetical protein
MMKFLIPLITLFLSNYKHLFQDKGSALTQQVILHIRAVAKVLVSAIASLVLSCVGISLLISSLATQLDKSEGFQLTNSMMVYVGMTAVSLLALFLSLRQKTWLKVMKSDEPSKSSNTKSGALESAVALLVLDFVEERQNRRKNSEPASAPVEP